MAKRESIFRFKQFDLRHGNSSMKVGTDAVLLGAWANVNNSERILDIGTGCGIIALMLAQKNNVAQIDAIDIDKSSVHEAGINFSNSPWNNRLNVFQCSIQSYKPRFKYDHIVSNPPFFTEGTSSPVDQRHSARHMDKLSFLELIIHSELLMVKGGSLSLIIPTSQSENCIDLANSSGLKLSRRLTFYPKKDVVAERSLMTFVKTDQKIITQEETLIHYDELNNWTEDYKILTKEFHLKL